MSISSEITRINTNIANAYTAVNNKGGTLPQTQNSSNLANAINSISNVNVQSDNNAKMKTGVTSLTLAGRNRITHYIKETPQITIRNNDKDLSSFFTSCDNLEVVGSINTEQVTSMNSMFSGCSKITTINLFTTSNVTNMFAMFQNCSSLTSIPQFDTSNNESFGQMFLGCVNLVTVPVLDTSKAKSLASAFSNCISLSNESLNNILTMCKEATLITTKTLSSIGLSSTQATTCTGLSNWSAAEAAGWTTGY